MKRINKKGQIVPFGFMRQAVAAGENTISSHPTLTTSMVSYYEFDEASGNLIDQHGSNDGTVTGPTYGVAGVINDAYSFTTNDFVNTGYTPTANSDVSYACWVKYDGTLSVYAAVMSNHNSGGSFGYHINITAAEKFQWVVTGVTGAVSADDIVDGQWYFVVGTYNATSNDAKLYVDGVLKDTKNGTANSNTGGTLHFGRAGAFNGRYLNGDMDLAGVWSKELTAQEVTDLTNSGDGLPYN